MSKKIIVVGSSNTDMVIKVPHIPAPGETVMGSELLTIPGGKGANQAVSVASIDGEFGVPMILNPAPGAKLFRDLLKKISIITPNETDAALLTGTEEVNDDTIPAMAKELYDMGIETVIITLGSRGVYLLYGDFHGIITGYRVKALDTTAAGDVFNFALAAALSGNKPVKQAIDFAQRATAISVTRRGAAGILLVTVTPNSISYSSKKGLMKILPTTLTR